LSPPVFVLDDFSFTTHRPFIAAILSSLQPAPLPMLMTEKEAVAAGIDATVTNVPVITAAAVVTRASEAATEEATMSGTSASVEVTAVPVESEAATAAETVVRKAMVKDALDATIPAERKVAPTIKSVSAAPIAEAPATDSVAPSTTLAASTTPSKRLSWSWPPGIRFNAEATARGFDQWHAPSPWRVLLSVHTVRYTCVHIYFEAHCALCFQYYTHLIFLRDGVLLHLKVLSSCKLALSFISLLPFTSFVSLVAFEF